ncbi:hypothetical protein H5410_040886 [Solanum commersonii]|uniref:Uncharacterized protein n=1 Tax=Solanum commersonii TaxID=4109 RepID=A0A9J5XSU6_SOLCO|nr:hypothetical protein H5410_040886 [Solanum commersonii]
MYSFPWDELFNQIRQSSLPSLGSTRIQFCCHVRMRSSRDHISSLKNGSGMLRGSNPKYKTNYKLATKLSLLKAKLKEWSKENKDNWRARKDQLLEQIGTLEIIQEARPLTNDELMMKA